jgi:hypothetical protein
MKIFLVFVLIAVASGCNFGYRPVTKIEEYLSKTLENHDLNLRYVANTLVKEYSEYIKIESLYFEENANQECLCKYVKHAQSNLQYAYTMTEECLPHDICDAPGCNVQVCCDQESEKFKLIAAQTYDEAKTKCHSHHHKCHHHEL